MKCGYGKDCKFDGEVNKDDAVKVGTRYFHKECADEKSFKTEAEKFWLDNFPQTTLMMLRKAINDLVKTNDAGYIVYVMKWIKANKKPINYPMGLKSYCNTADLRKVWNNKKVNEEYNKIKDKIVEMAENDNKIKYEYKPNNKRFTDIL